MSRFAAPALCVFLLAALRVRAQDAPRVSTAPVRARPDRVLWIFPNYRSVDSDSMPTALSAGGKLDIAFNDSFDPYAFPVAGLFAGVAEAENQYPSLGHGARAYGKYYAAALADQTLSNGFSEALFPILLRQDPRYFRLGRGGFWHRTGYSLTRVFVARGDDGSPQFNYSEFAGNAAMAAAGDLYYPGESRTLGDTAGRFGSQVVFDMLADFGKEFWPDIKRRLTGR